MKNLLVVLAVLSLITAIISNTDSSIQYVNHRKMIGQTVIYYNKTDSPYILCGVVKEVYRKYNYVYKDSFYHWDETMNNEHDKYWFTNEFGDTVAIIYTDYTGFPDDYRFR